MQPSECSFGELKARFCGITAILQQVEEHIDSERITDESASTHAKSVYCALQMRRMFESAAPAIESCEKDQNWQHFTFFSSLNSGILTKQPFRDAIIQIFEDTEAQSRIPHLFKSLLQDLADLAERVRHLKSLSATEAHYSTISLIKLNRLLELKNFEVIRNNSYEEFGLYNKSNDKLDVRIESTQLQGTLAANDGKCLLRIVTLEKKLTALQESLNRLGDCILSGGESSLRHARMWADVIDEKQCNFGVDSYVLKCERELQDCKSALTKFATLSKYLGEFLGVVQSLKIRACKSAGETVHLILQHVEAASHSILAAVLSILGQRMYDLLGKEAIKRYEVAKSAHFALENRRPIRSQSRIDKGRRLMSQFASTLHPANRKDTRGSTKKCGAVPNQAERSGIMHDDIVQEYHQAIHFTSSLMSEHGSGQKSH